MNGIILGALSGTGQALQSIGQQAQQTSDRQDLLKEQSDLEQQKAMAVADYQNKLNLNNAANERTRVQGIFNNVTPATRPQDIVAQTGDVGTATALQSMSSKEAEVAAKLQQAQTAEERVKLQGELNDVRAALSAAQTAQTGKEVTKDAFNNPILVDKATKEVTPLGNNGVSGGPGTPGLTGEDYLKTLSPNIAGQVKAISEGRQALPSGFAMKSPMGQQLLAAVSQYDPSFDVVNVGARTATRKDFTSGKSADNITALNTAISHLGRLSDNLNKLGNGNFGSVNAVENWAGNTFHTGGVQENLGRVGTDAEAVSHELAKVFRSTGMSEGEINAWKAKINPNMPPDAQKGVIGEALQLMNGRLESLATRYNTGMGTSKQGLELLTPEAQKTLLKLNQMTGDDSGMENRASVGGQQAPAVQPANADFSHLWK